MNKQKMLALPRITAKGVPGFLMWARRESPALYQSLMREFPEVRDFDTAATADGLTGIMSFLSSAGSSLSSAASRIGSFVKNNALPIIAAGVPLLIAKKQADVANSQYKLAAAQMAPMQTALTSQGGYVVPVAVRPVTGAAVPSWVWIGGAVALGVGAFLLTRRR